MRSTGQGGQGRRGGQDGRRDTRETYAARDKRVTRENRGSHTDGTRGGFRDSNNRGYDNSARDTNRAYDSNRERDNGRRRVEHSARDERGARGNNGGRGENRARFAPVRSGGFTDGRGPGTHNIARDAHGTGRHGASDIRNAAPSGTRGVRGEYGYDSARENVLDARDNPFDVEILAGRNSVYEALKAERPLNKILLQRGEPDGAGRAREGTLLVIEAIARDRGIVVQSVDRAKLEGLAGGSHQGVVAYASVKEYCLPDDILTYAAERAETPLVVVASEIEDPHNLGSIIRSAEAAGAHGVIVPKRRAAGLTPAVSKASSGAIEYMRVARVANIAETLRSLKKQGLWIVGADASGARLYTDCDFTIPTALVIGGEGAGLGRLVRETCDYVAKLPMLGNVTSLNASVAASVFLYEAVRQRAAPKPVVSD